MPHLGSGTLSLLLAIHDLAGASRLFLNTVSFVVVQVLMQDQSSLTDEALKEVCLLAPRKYLFAPTKRGQEPIVEHDDRCVSVI